MARSETGHSRATLQSEESIVDFLVGKAEMETAAAEPAAVQVPPPVLPVPEEVGQAPATGSGQVFQPAVGEKREIPLVSVRFPELVPGKQPLRIPGTLLHGVIILGGVLFVILLFRLIWQQPTTWPGFRALYSAGYTVALVITLIQWMFSLYLSKVLQGAEERQAETVRSQTLLRAQIDELATVNARLQKNTLQFQTVVQIAQDIVSELNPDELAQQAVKLIGERFDLYYVGLFLIDESGQWAVLRAGTGEAGRQMLAQGYRLRVGEPSMVGWCTASAGVCIAPEPDRAQPPSRGHQNLVEVNPLLPETRSEAALPLRSHGHLIGALDVQSTDRAAFSQEDVAVLQAVADQMAVAIGNAQAFAELRARLEKIEASQERAVRQRWAYSIPAQSAASYERARPGVTPLDDAGASQDIGALSQLIEQAVARREIAVRSDTGNGTGQAALVAPISLRGEVLGALGLHEPEGKRWWTEDEIALIEAIADQMALAIENARLLEETQQHAERERLIADISARVRASTNVETILRTAIRELGRALRASDGLIQLEGSEDELATRPTAESASAGQASQPAEGVVDDDGADA